MESIQETSSETSSANVIIAAGLGLAVGAAVALLLAPSEGKETREMLGEWFDKQKENIGQQKNRVNAAYQAGREAYLHANERKVAAR